MKTVPLPPSPSLRSRPLAFTLVELLVVISIIIVLAGLLFPAMNGVQESAKKLQAKNDSQSIINAAKAYSTDYGRLPLTKDQAAGGAGTSNSDTVYDEKPKGAGGDYTNDKLLNILLGKPHDDKGKLTTGTYFYNAKQIVFLEAKAAKDKAKPRNGLNAENRWYDPWGTPYCVWMDANYDNTITGFFGVYEQDDTNNPFPPTAVAVASFGKDLMAGDAVKKNKKYTGSDDVVSWR